MHFREVEISLLIVTFDIQNCFSENTNLNFVRPNGDLRSIQYAFATVYQLYCTVQMRPCTNCTALHRCECALTVPCTVCRCECVLIVLCTEASVSWYRETMLLEPDNNMYFRSKGTLHTITIRHTQSTRTSREFLAVLQIRPDPCRFPGPETY